MRRLTIDEARPTLEALLDPINFGRLDSIMPENGFLLDRTGREIDPDADYVVMSILASAGENLRNVRERLEKFKGPAYKFGQVLGEETRNFTQETGLNFVLQTGGCPGTGNWVIDGVREANPDVVLLALYPNGPDFIMPLESDPPHLEHYDFVLYGDRDVWERCTWVSAADINFLVHGGAGAFSEAATAKSMGKIISCYDIPGSERGASKSFTDVLKQSEYNPGDAIWFRNSDPRVLVRRAITEYVARRESYEGGLNAVALYHVEAKSAGHDDRLFLNFRPCELPVTYYHRGKRHTPLRQALDHGMGQDELVELFNEHHLVDLHDAEREKESIPRYERGRWFRFYMGEEGLVRGAFEEFISELGPSRITQNEKFHYNPQGSQLFYHRTF